MATKMIFLNWLDHLSNLKFWLIQILKPPTICWYDSCFWLVRSSCSCDFSVLEEVIKKKKSNLLLLNQGKSDLPFGLIHVKKENHTKPLQRPLSLNKLPNERNLKNLNHNPHHHNQQQVNGHLKSQTMYEPEENLVLTISNSEVLVCSCC